jgi:alkanesulfonate monooxygenase SsuD/methylene tetrahydromethanopterin reductase-like flavin-dependent oxidoreductase (luciferase family)
VSYDELLRDRLAYGTPDMVVERLQRWKDQLGLSGVIMEPNVGGRMPLDGVLRSIRLYANEVAPRLRPAKVA